MNRRIAYSHHPLALTPEQQKSIDALCASATTFGLTQVENLEPLMFERFWNNLEIQTAGVCNLIAQVTGGNKTVGAGSTHIG